MSGSLWQSFFKGSDLGFVNMCDLFIDLLTRCLQIYVDNLGVHFNSRRQHLQQIFTRNTFRYVGHANLHVRKDKRNFIIPKY